LESNGVTILGMTGDGKTVRKARARPTELGAAKPLTDQQGRFVEEYLLDMNAQAAAIRAGYSPTGQGFYSAVLARPNVRAAVDAAIAERVARTRVSADQVLGELGKVAFANMCDYVFVGADGVARLDLARLDRETGAAVSRLSVEYFKGADGQDTGRLRRVQVTLGDKRAALREMARHLGMYRDQVDVAVTGPTPIYVVTGVPRAGDGAVVVGGSRAAAGDWEE
jgi:phage terminase small subunit